MEVASLSARPRRRVRPSGPLGSAFQLPVRLEISSRELRESLQEELLTGPLSSSVRVLREGGSVPSGGIVRVTSSDAESADSAASAGGAELEVHAAIGASETSRALVFELMQALVAPGRAVRVRFSEKPRQQGAAPAYGAR